MDRTGGISIVVGGEALAMDEEMGKGDGVGMSNLFGNGVCLGNLRVAHSIERRWEIYLGMAMLDDRIVEDKE